MEDHEDGHLCIARRRLLLSMRVKSCIARRCTQRLF